VDETAAATEVAQLGACRSVLTLKVKDHTGTTCTWGAEAEYSDYRQTTHTTMNQKDMHVLLVDMVAKQSARN
jgi:hypothetical protein